MDNTYFKEYFENIKIQKRLNYLSKKYSGKKIIIYSVGKAFNYLLDNYDFSKLNIIGLSDIKFKDNEEYKGYKTFSAKTFMTQKPDLVLIGAIEPDVILDFFENELFPKYGKFKIDTIEKISPWLLIKKLFS